MNNTTASDMTVIDGRHPASAPQTAQLIHSNVGPVARELPSHDGALVHRVVTEGSAPIYGPALGGAGGCTVPGALSGGCD